MPPQEAKRKVDKTSFFLILILLVLAIFNLFNYEKNLTKRNSVLGASDTNPELEYWENFLAYNPDYLPGWLLLLDLSREKDLKDLEQKCIDQIKRLDPNREL